MSKRLTYAFVFFFFLEILGHVLIHLPSEVFNNEGYIASNKASIASLIYLCGGLGIAFIFFFRYISNTPSSSQRSPNSRPAGFHLWLFIALIGLMVQHYAAASLDSIPLDYRLADMLPVIDQMSGRFLDGQYVYALIPDIWEGMQPIYLPGFWLPYIFHHIFDFEMRWISVFWISSGLLLTLIFLTKEKASVQQLTIWASCLLCLLIPMILLPSFLITHTQEGIAIGYYLLLGYGLMSKRWRLTGVAIGLCLMSRYILAPWFIAFLITLLLLKERRTCFQVTGYAIITLILLFVGTRSYENIAVFISLPDQYLASVMNDQSKYLPIINDSLGLAKFVPYEQLSQLHFVFKILQFIIPVIGFILFALVRHKIKIETYAIGILKICLVFFYTLLILPYPYLFFVSTAFSMILLVRLLSDSDVSEVPPSKL